jgi:3-phosphoinositide dependent protein kinase-1
MPTEVKINSGDFKFGKTLGKGAFARVVHGKLKSTGVEYALKILQKSHIKKHDKTHLVMIEKKALANLDHPLVIR